MVNLLAESVFGQLARTFSGGRLLQSHLQEPDFDIDNVQLTKNEEGDLVVGWCDDNDPENPYNWPFSAKVYVTFLLFIMTMSVYMGSSIVSPSIPELSTYFNVGTTTATLSMSLFVWGYGFGPLLFSPITEISWVGRNYPYIICIGLFTILQIPNALVDNVAGFMILRFLCGFLGSPVLSTGGATIGDIWRLEGGFMNGLAFWGFGACGGPTLGPLISGYAVMKLGWRWSIWPLLMLNGLVWILLFFTMPETSGAAILSKRARRLRKTMKNDRIKSESEIQDSALTTSTLVYNTLWRPFQLTFSEPVLLCTNLYIAYLYGIIYCFFEAFPIMLMGNHGFNVGEMSVAYISGYIGAGVTCLFYCLYNNKVVLPRFLAGKWRPEYRMEPTFLGGVFFPITLFWFGWTSFSAVPWIVPLIGFAFFVSGAFLLFQGLFAYIGENFPKYHASAFASNGLFRALVGGAFPLFATQMFNKLTLQGGCSLLGGLAVLLLPITFVFYIYGPKLRAMSKRTGY
ncbi:hypothetical protein MVES1_004017 [Malassezia vespertilionis]|uniref:Major facilitator superfamily (MFS) profile domain-containing protein n=1 Tax=Malassezia vespertilionis TaxID=2020962 RepID=A0A2N1J7J1_9BASI|nr:uncharacterized protein MVES1_004017 [Malassezia vespertilionis]PKI82519.1 hypothetical protein MVES_003566 [Malassezia vespertilionis]WFD08640.1 hypothetical protein MVES1_004017 [Malassezia vespertilionis]